MADRRSSQKGKGRRREAEKKQPKNTSTKQSPFTDGGTQLATYVPSPPRNDNGKIATYMASLNTEQRNAISDFIQATKEPVSVAIQALQECQWDLLEAISRFGEDDEQEDEDNLDPSAPVIEPMRIPSLPGTSPRKRSHAVNTPYLRFEALHNTTDRNGKDNPRSPKSVVFDPITLDYSRSTADTPSTCMFISPYDEKM
mgnify:CR=1 FL=1